MLLKIVFIDDEPELGEIFMELFSSPNISIKTFTDPQLGVAEILNSPPDLIFLDNRLSNTTGDQIALNLNNSIAKVLITGDLTVNTKYPFEKIFKKPFKTEEIRDFIDSKCALKFKKIS